MCSVSSWGESFFAFSSLWGTPAFLGLCTLLHIQASRFAFYSPWLDSSSILFTYSLSAWNWSQDTSTLLMPPFPSKEICEYIGPIWIMQNYVFILNLYLKLHGLKHEHLCGSYSWLLHPHSCRNKSVPVFPLNNYLHNIAHKFWLKLVVGFPLLTKSFVSYSVGVKFPSNAVAC